MTARTRTLTSLAALGLAATLLLSGCSLLPRLPIPGGNDSDNNGGPGIDEIEENPFLDNTVPEGFPADVPLPDLEIYLGLRSTDDSWAIIYKSPNLEADYAGVVSQFESAGWETVMNNPGTEGSLGVFKKGEYQVQIMGVPDGGEFDGAGITFTVVRSS